MVIRAVGGEIGLRTKHFVHHIQAAHGEEITSKKQASLRERVVFSRRGNGNPGDGGLCAGEGLSAVLLCALYALDCGGAHRGGTPPPFHPPLSTPPPCRLPPANQGSELHLCLNGLLITRHERAASIKPFGSERSVAYKVFRNVAFLFYFGQFHLNSAAFVFLYKLLCFRTKPMSMDKLIS